MAVSTGRAICTALERSALTCLARPDGRAVVLLDLVSLAVARVALVHHGAGLRRREDALAARAALDSSVLRRVGHALAAGALLALAAPRASGGGALDAITRRRIPLAGRTVAVGLKAVTIRIAPRAIRALRAILARVECRRAFRARKTIAAILDILVVRDNAIAAVLARVVREPVVCDLDAHPVLAPVACIENPVARQVRPALA